MSLFERSGGLLYGLYRATLAPATRFLFHQDLIVHTYNYAELRWRGRRIWQNPLDLFTIQQTISELRPRLVVETGTNQGGSALFYADLLELIGGEGKVVTIDVERLHDLEHPRIECLLGSSVDPQIVARVRARAAEVGGPVLVILDSDHHRDHVLRELECYAELVTPGSWCLVQDGVVDRLPVFWRSRPGPLPAIERFLAHHPGFELDRERCARFPITAHPKGWLRRIEPTPTPDPERVE